MTREVYVQKESEPTPIMVCPQCVESGHLIDPRALNPNYPVVVSVCRTHQICNGEYDDLLGLKQKESKTQKKTDE